MNYFTIRKCEGLTTSKANAVYHWDQEVRLRLQQTKDCWFSDELECHNKIVSQFAYKADIMFCNRCPNLLQNKLQHTLNPF